MMTRIAVGIAGILIFSATGLSGGSTPNCQAQDKAWQGAEKACSDAIASVKRAASQVSQAADRVDAALKQGLLAFADMVIARDQADACHRTNGFTAKCAGPERAAAQAVDRYNAAVNGLRDAEQAERVAERQFGDAERSYLDKEQRLKDATKAADTCLQPGSKSGGRAAE